MSASGFEATIEKAVILLADSNIYTRRLVRTMLTGAGARSTFEANDGAAVLDAVGRIKPDVLIMDWDLAGLSGPDVVRVIRSPGIFPLPNLPIIMLTNPGLRSRVAAAVRLGVHEILVTPVSPNLLRERLASTLLEVRPMVRSGEHYVPMPRRRSDLKQLLAELPA
jgi:CheY-like chemotaxis protein